MPKPDDLRALLELLYELDYALPERRAPLQQRLDQLLSEFCEGTSVSRDELLEAVRHRYVEYRRNRRREERLQGARNLRSRPPQASSESR